MDNTPLISIITINFNNKNGLKRTFDSVFGQEFKNFEYIVIDGGSNDGSRELIEKNADKISFWLSESDKGIYNAMNKGIKAANGEYLLFLNSGDYFIKNEILLEIKDYITYYDLVLFDIIQRFESEEKRYFYPKNLSFITFLEGSIGHPSTFIHHELFEKFGLYEENYKIVSDWKFFLNALSDPDTTYIKHDIAICIFLMEGISSTQKEKTEQEKFTILQKEYPFFWNDISTLSQNNKKFLRLNYQFSKLSKSRLYQLMRKLGFFKYMKI